MPHFNKKKIFISGTGTDVGKSIVTAGIASLILKNNLTPALMKPVQTGLDEYSGDLDTIKSFVPDVLSLPNDISLPYAFNFPASPHLAAKLENKFVNPDKILKAIKQSENYNWDILLIEGAGGLMVPLNPDYLTIDLIKETNVPLVLVASLELGAINHTLLSLELIKQYNINFAGVIFNLLPQTDNIIAQDNISIIQEISKCNVLGIVRKAKPLTNGNLDFEFIKNEFANMDKLQQFLLS